MAAYLPFALNKREMMSRFVSAVILGFVATACAQRPERLYDAASVAYESGQFSAARTHLEQGDRRNYVVGNFLAFLSTRDAFYDGRYGGYKQAMDLLSGLELPEKRPARTIDRYIAILKFGALGNSGAKLEADAELSRFCPSSLEQLARRVCLRQQLADIMLYVGEASGEDSRFYRELLEISQAAYIKTYGWDPREPTSGVDPDPAVSTDSYE